MEPKPTPGAHGDAPAEAPRRRGGGGKRKSSGSSFTPSKRQAKERNAAFHVPPHMLHSGPLTRAARQSPHKLASTPPESGPASASASAAGERTGGGQVEGDTIRPEGAERAEELPLVDEVFEAVRSRGAGVHVVPTFAGWFSWKEIHSVEKQTLPSFFNGKSEKRTPEVYLKIRNSIMMKFHANPQLQLESKDLTQLSTGEVDARQEIFEFLDHWGLINFHPFPIAGPEDSKIEESQQNLHDEEKVSLIEQLFKFEPVQSYMIPLPKKEDMEAPAPLPTLFPDPVLVEDVVTAVEPSVEYHCNSCSVDCSRKRYHCRTQADFDLCCDCYNEGKFDAGMSKTDFILMDSAEVSGGASGTSWTDEETLLLLEGLEIFGGKWAEIAEHVATKTKAQCMLHFLQMQIEDRFHDGEDIHQNIPGGSTDQALTEKDTAQKPDKMKVDDKAEEKDNADEKPAETTEGNCEEEKKEDASAEANKDTQNSGGKDSVASPNTEEPKQSSDAHPSADVDTSSKNLTNVAIDILKSAFEAIGQSPDHEGSFADIGNPVMALAAFLAGLVEDDNATTSCRSSLKAISEVSPSLQLASRHCFILEDPPNDLKDTCDIVSNKNTDGDQTKDEDMIQTSIGNEEKNTNEKEDSTLSLDKPNNSTMSPNNHQESEHKNMSSDDCPSVDAETNNAKVSVDPPLLDKSTSNEIKGNTAVASNLKLGKDKPSTELEASDETPLKGKDELDQHEDAASTPAATVQEQKQSQTFENGKIEEPNNTESLVANEGSIVTASKNDSITKLKRAAATAISAAGVKAKFLAEHEEYQIRRLTALMIEKLFQKIEVKMSLFAEIEQVVLRTREYTEKTRKKLLMERNAIIAARMGALPSRTNQPGLAGNRLPPGYGNPTVRAPNTMPRPSS